MRKTNISSYYVYGVIYIYKVVSLWPVFISLLSVLTYLGYIHVSWLGGDPWHQEKKKNK